MILQFHEDLQYLFPEQVNVEAATPLDALKLIAVQHPLSGKMEPVPVRIKELRELDLTIDPTLADSGRVYQIVPIDALELSAGYAGAGLHRRRAVPCPLWLEDARCAASGLCAAPWRRAVDQRRPAGPCGRPVGA